MMMTMKKMTKTFLTKKGKNEDEFEDEDDDEEDDDETKRMTKTKRMTMKMRTTRREKMMGLSPYPSSGVGPAEKKRYCCS